MIWVCLAIGINSSANTTEVINAKVAMSASVIIGLCLLQDVIEPAQSLRLCVGFRAIGLGRAADQEPVGLNLDLVSTTLVCLAQVLG